MARRLLTRLTVSALLAGTAAALEVATSGAAHAAANCHYNNVPLGDYFSQVLSSGSTGDMRYPATLHGATIRLFTHTADASVHADVAGARSGDVLSVDRSNFKVTGSAEYYFQTTDWIQARGTWDYCERTVGSSGTAAVEGVDGAHRYIRVCLRRSGALQCANKWYGDNDDETGDATAPQS